MRRFLILESDTLTKPEMLAAIQWCRQSMRLRAIVDTAGKSLHAWFDMPDDETLEQLRVILPAWGFDPALFKPSQPCRFPGVQRPDKGNVWQRLLWIDTRATSDQPIRGSLPVALLTAMTTKDQGKFWTATELIATEFPEAKFIVPDLIPVGLSLLVGPPKIGKSWLTLGIALAVTTGGLALGEIHVDQIGVLLLALEDSPRRLQKRMRQMLEGRQPNARLIIRTVVDGWEKLDAGGLEKLAAFLKENPAVRCVIIDTLQKIKPGGRRQQNSYENDYAAITPLHKLANEHEVAIILVHHTRKTKADDVFEEISGSHGLTGVADTMLVIKRPRGEADAILHVTGRDVEEQELALRFDKTTGAWTYLGDAREVCASQQRQTVFELLKAKGNATVQDVLAALSENQKTKVSEGSVKMLLTRMVSAGELLRTGRGVYALATVNQKPTSADSTSGPCELPTNKENDPMKNKETSKQNIKIDVTSVTRVAPVTSVTSLPSPEKIQKEKTMQDGVTTVTSVTGVTGVTSLLSEKDHGTESNAGPFGVTLTRYQQNASVLPSVSDESNEVTQVSQGGVTSSETTYLPPTKQPKPIPEPKVATAAQDDGEAEVEVLI
jgi:hypothetical protein